MFNKAQGNSQAYKKKIRKINFIQLMRNTRLGCHENNANALPYKCPGIQNYIMTL
jgi:hypothetical protein